MSDLKEPTDHGYVLVRHGDSAFSVYRRRDDWAEANGLGDAHWFSQTNANDHARTWVGVCDLGEIGYVGEIRKVSA